jgi:hypothetical protein
MNLSCQQIVLFSGVIATPRTISEVHFELPQKVESVKLCAALIAWNLDQFSEFRNIHHIDWLEDGRRNKTLLPWVKDLAAWNACPKCIVDRAWLRLALNKLAEHLSDLPDEDNVIFSFDGLVFSVRCDGGLIAVAAKGSPWTVSFNVRVGALRQLPKRLMQERIEVSLWESHISIGSQTYPGTLGGLGLTDSSRVQ